MKLLNKFNLFSIFLFFVIVLLIIKHTKKEGFDNNINETFDLIVEKINIEIENNKNNERKMNELKDALDYTNYIRKNLF